MRFYQGKYHDNLGIKYSAGTFTVCAADGSDLNARNSAVIVAPSKANPGLLKLYRVLGNQSFIDDAGSSNIIGNLFGLTTGIAASNAMPFYLYACTNDAEDTITFGISRTPHMPVAPGVSDLGTPSSAVADNDESIFLFNSVTVGDYDGNPVVPLGSFRMVMSASDDWTVQTLDDQDGIDNWNERRVFTGNAGQFGADSGTFARSNGGTAATFINNLQQYQVFRNGWAYVNTALRQDAGTDGSGAVNAQFVVPCKILNILPSHGGQFPNVVLIYRNAGASELGQAYALAGSHNVQMNRMGTTTNDQYEWQDFGNGQRTISSSLWYKMNG